MNKRIICSDVLEILHTKYNDFFEKEEILEEDLLKIINESYELACVKYCKKNGDLKTFLMNSIQEDTIISLGLEDVVLEGFEFEENEYAFIDVEDETYKNIEEIIKETTGKLNKEEMDILAAKNIPLVHSIVRKFSNTGIEYDELLSAGFVGYAKALNTFMKGKNVKFSTYAYRCILNEILYFLRREKRHKDNDVSLFKPISTDKNGNVMTVDSTISTEAMGHKSVEDEVVVSETVKIMLEIVDEYLSENESFIIRSRYGIGNIKPKTQKEIADEIGMSQANVSKLEKGISDKIKKIMSSKYKIKSI